MKNWSRSTQVTVLLVVVLLGWAIVRSIIYGRMAHIIAHEVVTQRSLEAARKLILKQKLARVFKDGTDHAKGQAIRACQALAADLTMVEIEDHHMTMAEAAAGALVEFLADLELPVRAMAADALGRMGKPAAHPLLDNALNSPDKDVRTNATLALEAIGHVAVPEMIEAVKTGKPTMRIGAARALGSLRTPRAVDALITALSALEQDVRLTCRDALVELGEPAVDPLIDALDNADRFTRQHSAEALGEIADARAAEPLLELFEDSHRLVRQAAIYAVGKVGEPVAVEPLIAALDDPDRDLREAAAVSLGQIEDLRGVPRLIRALEDEAEGVAQASAAALGRIRPSDADQLTAVIDAARSSSEGTRLAAVFALGRIGDERTAMAVAERLDPARERSVKVRRRAAEALGSLAAPRSVEALIGAFDDPDWRVNYAAQEALSAIGEPAVEPLVARLAGAGLRARYARKALVGMETPPVDRLAALVRGGGEAVTLAATLALVDIGSDEAMTFLRDLAVDEAVDRAVRRAAQRGLESKGITLGDEADEPAAE